MGWATSKPAHAGFLLAMRVPAMKSRDTRTLTPAELRARIDRGEGGGKVAGSILQLLACAALILLLLWR
jgi:hypothetical protein